uniref:Uncharacterized protein n=1 Tax=Oryza barthii TaxID=65489 RepID=A0A0D3FXC4_9ORYZ
MTKSGKRAKEEGEENPAATARSPRAAPGGGGAEREPRPRRSGQGPPDSPRACAGAERPGGVRSRRPAPPPSPVACKGIRGHGYRVIHISCCCAFGASGPA